jgi:hypothetical protein
MEKFTKLDQEILDKIEFDIALMSPEAQDEIYNLLRMLTRAYPNVATLGEAVSRLTK